MLMELALEDAIRRIEDRDGSMRNIRKAGEGCFAGIAAGCGEDGDRIVSSFFAIGFRKQMGQDGQGDVLEGTGRAMPEFHKPAVADLGERNDVSTIESRIVGAGDGAMEFILGIAVQQDGKDVLSSVLVALVQIVFGF